MPLKPPNVQFNPKRLSGKEKAVTVALGFKAPESIILCSDSLVIKEDQFGFYETKFFAAGGENWSVMTMYAGFRQTMKRVNELLDKKLKSVAVMSVASIRDAFESTLASEHKAHRVEVSGLSTLCAISVGDENLELLTSKGKLVSEAECECIGVGHSALARYLFGIAFPIGRAIDARHSMFWGIYVMKQVKKFIPHLCGGDTHAFEILSGGRIKPYTEAHKVEVMCEALELGISSLMATFCSPYVSDLEFESECERFSARLRDLRRGATDWDCRD